MTDADASFGRRPRGCLLLGATLALGGCVGVDRDALYQPAPASATAPVWSGRAPQSVSATTGDGMVLTGWYWPDAGAGGPLLVYFPGNSGNADSAALQAAPLAEGGHAVLVASYRGYGGNPGRPDEAGLYADGAAWGVMARSYAGDRPVALFGNGLGAAVALHEAAERQVAAVVTLGAFARLRNFSSGRGRSGAFAPNPFDGTALIARVDEPVLIMHGRSDEVVAFAEAERLRAAATGPAWIAPIDGEATHRFDLRYIAPVIWQALPVMIAGTTPPGATPPPEAARAVPPLPQAPPREAPVGR